MLAYVQLVVIHEVYSITFYRKVTVRNSPTAEFSSDYDRQWLQHAAFNSNSIKRPGEFAAREDPGSYPAYPSHLLSRVKGL